MFHPEGPTFRELMVQAMSSTERGYDLLAPKFDRTPFRTPDPILHGVAGVIREYGPIDAAIDLCCGTGAGIGVLRPLCERRVLGVDSSRGMLAEAERRLPTMPGTASIELVQADVLALPFAREFDVATCFGAFGHVDEPHQPSFAAEIHKVLVPGGRFVFATHPPVGLRDREWWMYRGFNAVMRARNAVWKPSFVMYYLNFQLPRARAVLEAAGFRVETVDVGFPAPFERYRVVVATKV